MSEKNDIHEEIEEVVYEEVEDILVKVTVIRSKGQASLVQWNDSGRTRRTIVPRQTVVEDEAKRFYVEWSSLEMGIPYGINWESHLQSKYFITGASIAEKLEGSGIWTKEDFDKSPSVVQSCVLAAAREILSELGAAARKSINQED